VICSDEFAPLGRAESRNLGMGKVPIAVIPHPLAGNKPDEVQRKAEAIAEEVIAILTQPAEKLAHEYRERFLKPVGKQVHRLQA
jgi:predicted dienelactone hydrolase